MMVLQLCKEEGKVWLLLLERRCPQLFPVHSLTHSLNLCLQDAGRQIQAISDAIREIVKLINYSTLRQHLFVIQEYLSYHAGINLWLLFANLEMIALSFD